MNSHIYYKNMHDIFEQPANEYNYNYDSVIVSTYLFGLFLVSNIFVLLFSYTYTENQFNNFIKGKKLLRLINNNYGIFNPKLIDEMNIDAMIDVMNESNLSDTDTDSDNDSNSDSDSDNESDSDSDSDTNNNDTNNNDNDTNNNDTEIEYGFDRDYRKILRNRKYINTINNKQNLVIEGDKWIVEH